MSVLAFQYFNSDYSFAKPIIDGLNILSIDLELYEGAINSKPKAPLNGHVIYLSSETTKHSDIVDVIASSIRYLKAYSFLDNKLILLTRGKVDNTAFIKDAYVINTDGLATENILGEIILILKNNAPVSSKRETETLKMQCIVIPTTLNIRSGPEIKHSVVGTLKRGEIVNVVERTYADWYKINRPIDGYVFQKYLRPISEVQEMLKKTVAPKLIADGDYGPSTAAAVKLFQKNNKLEITGEVDEETFKRLEEEARKADLPPEETTFEPEKEGEDGEKPGFWILKLNPGTWKIDELKEGGEGWFNSHDQQNKQRPEYELFTKVKTGDRMIGYAFEPENKIVCEFTVLLPLSKNENLGEGISIRVTQVISPAIPLKELPGVLEAPDSYFTTEVALSGDDDKRLFPLSEEEFTNLLKKVPGQSGVTTSTYFTNSRFSIRDGDEAVLGVTDIAREMAQLINNLQTKESGRMVGVFGHWGRGKTFLVKKIKDELKAEPTIKYHFVDFHAWKYQDTHASWAYLYQAFAKKYFEYPVDGAAKKPGRIKQFRHDYRKRVVLNMERHGSWPIVRLAASVAIIAIAASIAATIDEKVAKAFWLLLTTAGIADTVRLIAQRFREHKIKENATEVFKQYFEKPTYKDLLGVQSEIQGELTKLLKCWIPVKGENGENKEERILLFVDDIDRCSEDRLVQLIDALRVMLEDPEISERVVVLIAIDERVLRRAIKWKYKELLDADRLLEDDAEWKKTTLQITSEYMDKLFISGIKLGTLTGKERGDIYRKYTNGKVQPKPEIKSESSTNEKNINTVVEEKKDDTGKLIPGTGENSKPKPKEDAVEPVKETDEEKKKQQSDESKKGDSGKEQKTVTNFELSFEEDLFLNNLVCNLDEVNPRHIRIFYFRYMLARNLLTAGLTAGNNTQQFDSKKRNELLSTLLAHYTNLRSNEELLADRKKLSSDASATANTTIEKIINAEDPALIAEILEALEMVIAY